MVLLFLAIYFAFILVVVEKWKLFNVFAPNPPKLHFHAEQLEYLSFTSKDMLSFMPIMSSMMVLLFLAIYFALILMFVEKWKLFNVFSLNPPKLHFHAEQLE